MRAAQSWYEFAEILRRENRTLQEISSLLGVSIPTIRGQLVQRMKDYETFKQPTYKTEDVERTKRIESALANGEGCSVIADRENVSRQWVYVIKNRGDKRIDAYVKREVDRTLLGDKLKKDGVIA